MSERVRSIQYGNTTFHYQVRRRRGRETLELTVDQAGGITVTAPGGTSDERIAATVRSKAPWIMAQWRRQARLLPPPPGRRFVSGESIAYLGRTYQFRVRKLDVRQVSMSMQAGTIEFRVPKRCTDRAQRTECRQLLVSWLRERTALHGQRACGRICRKLGLEPVDVAVRDIGRRWGSCTPSGRVLLHWKAVLAPMPLFEYVCAHEVCHILHRDHSAAFRRALDRALPEWRDLAARLESRGYRYDL